MLCFYSCFFFFFNDTATTEIYTLSLHDALPIFSLEKLRSTPYFTSAQVTGEPSSHFTPFLRLNSQIRLFSDGRPVSVARSPTIWLAAAPGSDRNVVSVRVVSRLKLASDAVYIRCGSRWSMAPDRTTRT